MGANFICLCRTSFPWVVLGLFLAFAHSSGIVGFLTIILTSSALIFSPVIIESRTRTSCVEKFPRTLCSDESHLEQSYEVNDVVTIRVDDAIIIQKTDEVQSDDIKGYLLSSSDALSDSESQDRSSSNSSEECSDENDWMFRDDGSFSDGSISDEESFIEISLPTAGHYSEPKRWSDCCSLETLFKQQNLMEMLGEMNEENLIEIDICMGSIKCSRFGIHA